MDFAAARHADGRWDLYALEVNLRKGGTTHPFGVLRHVVPGAYDADLGEYRAPGGPAKFYWATDNMVDAAWTGMPPERLVGAVERAGLTFDRDRGTGVVLHMLSGLAIDGRFGLTAIADSEAAAAELSKRRGRAPERQQTRAKCSDP